MAPPIKSGGAIWRYQETSSMKHLLCFLPRTSAYGIKGLVPFRTL